MDDEALVRLVRRVADQHGARLTPSVVIRSETDFPVQAAAKLLKMWGRLGPKIDRPAAPLRATGMRATDDDLLAEYDRVRMLLGRDPTWAELNRDAMFSRQTYRNRIGRIAELREVHRQWAELRDRAAAGDPEAGKELRERAVAAGTILPRTSLLAGVASCPEEGIPEELMRLFAEALGMESLTASA